MAQNESPALPWPRPAHDPEREVLALSEQTLRTLAVARAMAESDRPVDLGGLQDHVGLLCAKALDLPPGRAGFIRLELSRLAGTLDALHDLMRERPA